MKKILISIRPQWVAKILNGEKTLEIRKSAPKDLPCEVFIYCTKSRKGEIIARKGEDLSKQFLYLSPFTKSLEKFPNLISLNGKAVAKFTLNKVGEIHNFPYGYEMFVSHADIRREGEICQKACLTSDELREYLPCDKERYGYAWYIDNLVIFDKPKELGDFIDSYTPTYEQAKPFLEMLGKPYSKETYREHCERLGYTLKRPPQSWQYVEVAE